jgi:hypothetical protein
MALGGLASAAQVAAAFTAAPVDRIAELLETLVTLGQARETDKGWFVQLVKKHSGHYLRRVVNYELERTDEDRSA